LFAYLNELRCGWLSGPQITSDTSLPISLHIGANKSRIPPLFHALSGSDTTSSFVGHGKKEAWAVWKFMGEDLNNAFLEIIDNPDTIQGKTFSIIERFTILYI
jgi:hypothetical protein